MWLSSWPVIKDVVLTVTGAALIISQSVQGVPSVPALVAGLVLTGATATFQAGRLISARMDGGRSLPPSTAPRSPPGSSSSHSGSPAAAERGDLLAGDDHGR